MVGAFLFHASADRSETAMKIPTGALRRLRQLALTIAGVYLALCVGFTVFQRSLLYFPPPSRCCLPQKSMQLHVDDIDLIIATRAYAGPDAIIYFGGNGEDVVASMAMYAAAFPTRALYLLNYRGYGGSGGRPSEPAIQRDALALFDTVRRSHSDIVVIGRSLGSGVAAHLATQRPVSKLILVTPYASILALAQQRYPYFPVRWMLQDKFESWRDSPLIQAPTLLVAAGSYSWCLAPVSWN